ncbi:MAG: helix-turn-helix domain-containing protein [Cyanobacteriota bacterium]
MTTQDLTSHPTETLSTSKLFAKHPEANGLANPMLIHLRLHDKLSQSLELLQQALPITQLHPIHAEKPWWHYGTSTSIGSIQTHAGISSPAKAILASDRDLTLLLGYGGTQMLESRSEAWTCHKNNCLLLPAEPFGCTSSLSSGVALRLDPERLLQTAVTMGGLNRIPLHWREILQEVQNWPLHNGVKSSPLQWALRQVMEVANQLAQLGQPLLNRLQLDDQVYRLVASMLFPELLRTGPLDRLRQRDRQGKDAFDELIDYIGANLSQPLNLTELEQRSHYSRRALQYAFRERLDCTASQWIRRQRLDLAQQRLQNPLPEDSVASIAVMCGYRSMSLFSVDFQQRFHVKPSQLLREARSALPTQT